jgi:hypothetical protein
MFSAQTRYVVNKKEQTETQKLLNKINFKQLMKRTNLK